MIHYYLIRKIVFYTPCLIRVSTFFIELSYIRRGDIGENISYLTEVLYLQTISEVEHTRYR